jgi:nucleoside 2-deoxyribosyltransferase
VYLYKLIILKLVKIYFAGSIRGGRDDVDLYRQLIEYLSKYGEVLTEHVGSSKLSSQGEDGDTDKYIYDRDMEWLSEADVIVAEVTQTSLGVGYEIGRAVGMGKNILCMYRPQEGKRLSAMIKGCRDVTNVEYSTLEEGKKILDEYFNNLSH